MVAGDVFSGQKAAYSGGAACSFLSRAATKATVVAMVWGGDGIDGGTAAMLRQRRGSGFRRPEAVSGEVKTRA
jgi:hypothetical protein